MFKNLHVNYSNTGSIYALNRINSTSDFHDQSQVMNGASYLYMEIFGDAGKHSPMAVTVSALPYNVAVEVEGVFEIATI